MAENWKWTPEQRAVLAERRAARAEFLLAIMAECVGRRFMEINVAIWPGPVKHPEGYWFDGTDAVRAVRHDLIRKLFHEGR